MRKLAAIATAVLALAGITRGEPVKVLIITGDHGHDWKATTPHLKEVLTSAGHTVTVTEAASKDLTADTLAKFDVLLLNYRDTAKGAKDNPASVWSDDNKTAFTAAVKGGKGLVVYHHASAAFVAGDFAKEFETITAGGWRKQGNHGKMHEFTVTPRKADHPVTSGVAEFKHGRDELYQNSLVPAGSQVLVTAYSDKDKDPKNTGKHEPVVWVAEYGKGRVYHNSLGHDVQAMKSSPGFAVLLVRGVEWAATGKASYTGEKK